MMRTAGALFRVLSAAGSEAKAATASVRARSAWSSGLAQWTARGSSGWGMLCTPVPICDLIALPFSCLSSPSLLHMQLT